MTCLHFSSAAVALMVSSGIADAVGAVKLAASTDVSDTGYYRISWEVDDGSAVVELQESLTTDFDKPTAIYEGLDRSSVLSGRLDGTYYYRARTMGGAWSQPVTVTVQHHSLAEAFLFLAMGAAVFLATALLIIGGHIKHKRAMVRRDVA